MYWVFQVYFRPDLITVHCFGASVNIVLNQRSLKLIDMSMGYTWFSVIMERLSLCRYCHYINQILNDFFIVYYYIQHPRYNNICIFTIVLVFSECDKSGTWVIKCFWKIHYNVNLSLHTVLLRWMWSWKFLIICGTWELV